MQAPLSCFSVITIIPKKFKLPKIQACTEICFVSGWNRLKTENKQAKLFPSTWFVDNCWFDSQGDYFHRSPGSSSAVVSCNRDH